MTKHPLKEATCKRRWNFGTLLLFVLAPMAFAALAGCGGARLKTTTIHFRCDSEFNESLLLPVDLVFIPGSEKLATVTQVAPDEWFDSEVRENWPTKQSVSLSATGSRKTVTIKLKKDENTQAMVIFADFRNVAESRSQMIVLDEDAKENEDIFVTINGLLH